MELITNTAELLVSHDILSEDWAEELGPFINSQEFAGIMSEIRKRKASGINIYPKTQDVFRAFNVCPVDKVKVILGLQDPYHQAWGKGCVADGIPMSCSYSKSYQPSLSHFNQAIKATTGRETDVPCDLSYLSIQGILMLNKSLTVEAYKPNSMQGLWDKFHDYLFTEVINKMDTPIIYMLMGRDASWFSRFARMGDTIITSSHPASAAYSGGQWNHDNIFLKVNTALKQSGYEEIKW